MVQYTFKIAYHQKLWLTGGKSGDCFGRPHAGNETGFDAPITTAAAAYSVTEYAAAAVVHPLARAMLDAVPTRSLDVNNN